MSGECQVPTLAEHLTRLTLEVRDVSTNDAWAEAYAMEVPILSLVMPSRYVAAMDVDAGEDENEKEIRLPRPAPRLSPARLAVRLSQDVTAAMAGEGGARKGWTTSAGGAGGGDDDAAAATKKTRGGRGWAVVSENPF